MFRLNLWARNRYCVLDQRVAYARLHKREGWSPVMERYAILVKRCHLNNNIIWVSRYPLIGLFYIQWLFRFQWINSTHSIMFNVLEYQPGDDHVSTHGLPALLMERVEHRSLWLWQRRSETSEPRRVLTQTGPCSKGLKWPGIWDVFSYLLD